MPTPRMRAELDAVPMKHSIFDLPEFDDSSRTPRKRREHGAVSPASAKSARDSVSGRRQRKSALQARNQSATILAEEEELRKRNVRDSVSPKKTSRMRIVNDSVTPPKRKVKNEVSSKRRKSDDGHPVTIYFTSPASLRAPRHDTSRSMQPFPEKLLTQATYGFEEKLYRDALNLTARALESGLETGAPARIPPHQHIALASNLSVHPNFNTRTNKKAHRADSNHALRYLRQLTRTVEPPDAGLHKAFQYGIARRQRSKRSRMRNSDLSSDEDDDTVGKIDNKLVKEGSLWNNTEDFWSVVGWAFNCSVMHKARWERWAAWLEQILDVLQRDLDWHLDTEARNVDIAESLLAQYLSTIGQGWNNQRRVMRAVLAEGSKTSMGQFPEVWRNETRPPKKKKKDDNSSNKSKTLDIENGQFGNYFDNDTDEESEETKQRRSTSAAEATARPRRSAQEFEAPSCSEEEDDEDELSSNSANHQSVEAFGGLQSVQLRQRFFALLAHFSSRAPHLFLEISDLFAMFTEFVRPLSLPVFQQFVLPTKPYLDLNAQASLNEMLIQSLLGTGQPSYDVTKEVLATDYAPYAATNSTVADNAKVSLLIESLLRSLWRLGLLTDDLTTLRVSIDEGIQARDEKISGNGRKKAGKRAAADEEAKAILHSSAGRMRILLELAGKKTEQSSFQVLADSQRHSKCSGTEGQSKDVDDATHGVSPEQDESKDFKSVS